MFPFELPLTLALSHKGSGDYNLPLGDIPLPLWERARVRGRIKL